MNTNQYKDYITAIIAKAIFRHSKNSLTREWLCSMVEPGNPENNRLIAALTAAGIDMSLDDVSVHAASGECTTVYMWTEARMTDMGVSVNAIGNANARGNGTAVSVKNALLALNEDRPKSQRFSQSTITGCRDLIIEKWARERLAVIRRDFCHVPSEKVQGELIELMRAGVADDSFTPEETASLILKFIWQVRRKLFGLKVSNHLMPVLVGLGGSGKSEFVNHLCEPLREITAETDFQKITDDRNIQLFKNYIGVMDEMEKAERADVESLKHVITADWMSRRPMRENSLINIKQNLTFIGTANKDVSESILDDTGNRRFAQINIISKDHPNREDFWRRVREMDWLALWLSVDEAAEDPTAWMADKLAKVQAAEVNKSLVETWVEYLMTENHQFITQAGSWVSIQNLYEDYSQWESNNAPRWGTLINSFAKQFKRLARQGVIPFQFDRTEKGNGYECLGKPKPTPIPEPVKATASHMEDIRSRLRSPHLKLI